MDSGPLSQRGRQGDRNVPPLLHHRRARGSADAVRDPRGFDVKLYTEDGNYDVAGNNTPIFFIQDPRKSPRLHQFAEATRPRRRHRPGRLSLLDAERADPAAAATVPSTTESTLRASRQRNSVQLVEELTALLGVSRQLGSKRVHPGELGVQLLGQ
jgi:hypothetical protein